MLILALLAMATQEPTAQPAPPAAVVTPATSPEGFQVGIDTMATVKAKLGKPNATEGNSDGTTTIRYAATKTSVKGASFIPIVGMFAGGATAKISTKSFTFGPDGLLKNFASSDTRMDCGMVGNCH